MTVAAASARDKIKTIVELAALAETERSSGKTIALCHGVFDLVHPGHLRHLEAAAREGDVLVVTITADRFVNKGPGRPIFGEDMRAEMIAGFSCVRWVAINHAPSAEPILDTVKPDVYVKGSDYENPEEDVTGKIASEQRAVEEHGGRLVLTRDITFSSSSIINRYLDVYDPPLRDFLNSFRERTSESDIAALLKKVEAFRVLLVGDTIIDEYEYIEALGKSAKENIIATRHINIETFGGGIIAAANHVANICSEVDVVTVLGDDDPREGLIRGYLKPNVSLHVVRAAGRPTTRKRRFVDPGYFRKLFEVYYMNDRPLDKTESDLVDDHVRRLAGHADVVIVTDFGHGAIGPSTVETLCAHARFLAVNTQTNSGNLGFNLITKYPHADYVCIDAPEARLAVGDKYSDIETLTAENLPVRVDCARIVVTHGAAGCCAWSKEEGVRRVPAFTKTIVDTVGAGDAFLAITSPFAAAGATMEQIGFIGNAAGAMKVGIVGHRASVEKVPLRKFVTTLLK